jgi:hypothetical protein
VLDGEGEVALLTSQVEVGVTPGVEVPGAAETLAGLPAGAAVLAGVVDDEDGDVEVALERAEIAEEGGDLPSVVLVDAVEADEGIEHEQARMGTPCGPGQAVLIAALVDAQGGLDDDIEGQPVDGLLDPQISAPLVVTLGAMTSGRKVRRGEGRR